jgi:hypothetical protein
MTNPPPKNLYIEPERDYKVRILWPDGNTTHLKIYQRMFWKRLSAIAHARQFARRNPQCRVYVECLS